MKKFRFSLQKLKDYKVQVLEKQKETLRKLRRELFEIDEQIQALKQQLKEKNEELYEVYKTGANSFEISLHKRFIVNLQQEIKTQQNMYMLKDLEVQNQLKVVVSATQDVNTLENLEEKQLEEYKKLETKENELFIEEFVVNSSFRNEA